MNYKKNEIFICLLITIFYYMIVLYFTKINILSLLLPTIVFIIYFLKNIENIKNKKYVMIYIFLIFLDLALVVYNCIYKNLPFTNVDWYNYDLFAKSALSMSNSIFEIISNSIDLFTGFVAIIYKIFGYDIKIIYFYILPCAQIMSYYMYKCVFEITNDKNKSVVASIIILMYPTNFIFSLSVLREIPIQMLLLISAYNLIKYLKNNNIKYFIISIIFSIFCCLMHSGMIGVFISQIYLFVQKKFSKKIKYFNVKAIIFSLLIFIIICLTPIGNKIMSRFNNLDSINDIVNIVNSQNTILEANTQYIVSSANSLQDIILTLPYRYIMFVFSPFIWQVYSFGTILSFVVDAIPRLIIGIYIIKIFKKFKEQNSSNKNIFIILLIGIIISQIIFSLGCNNYGQAMRHRSKLLPLELILIVSFFNVEKRCINNERK